MTARGIRNNNPGNIRIGQDWKGEVPKGTNTDGAFEQFSSPQYGIRAIAKILRAYSTRGLDTIREIINTWAPPVENNTDAYINSVSISTGFGPDDCLDMTSIDVQTKIIEAIIMHENGVQPYSIQVIQEGIRLS